MKKRAKNNNEKKGILALIRDSKGMSTVEYAILLAVITAVAFVTWDEFGTKVHESIMDSKTKIALP